MDPEAAPLPADQPQPLDGPPHLPEEPARSNYAPPPKRPPRDAPEPPPPHPGALRWLQGIERAFAICRKGAEWSIILLFLSAPVCWILAKLFLIRRFPGSSIDLFEIIACGWLGFAGLFLAIYLLLMILRLWFLTFFFAKFSLGQFMAALLLFGFLVSLIVELRDGWRIPPALVLAVLFWIILVYVQSYDPIHRSGVLPRAARDIIFNPPGAPKPQVPSKDAE